MVSIVDLSNFSIGGVLDSKFKEGQQRGQELFDLNYPNATKNVYLINAPGIFQIVWKACTWFMTEKTLNKIHILGDNYMKVLDEKIGIENLPTSIGGKNPTPIREYKNFWDKELELSYKEQRFSRVK